MPLNRAEDEKKPVAFHRLQLGIYKEKGIIRLTILVCNLYRVSRKKSIQGIPALNALFNFVIIPLLVCTHEIFSG